MHPGDPPLKLKMAFRITMEKSIHLLIGRSRSNVAMDTTVRLLPHASRLTTNLGQTPNYSVFLIQVQYIGSTIMVYTPYVVP